MSNARDTQRRCTGALALRTWALGALRDSVTAGSSAIEHPPEVGPDVWSVFLARERCASLLFAPETGSASLRGHGPEPFADVPEALRTRAMEAARRTLAARALLQQIDAILADAGIDAVVLKGGTAAVRGETIDLADVDLLVAPDRAEEVAGRLEASLALAPDGPDPRVGGRGVTHLAPRKADGTLPVEIHFSLRYMPDPAELLRRSVALAGLRCVRALAPQDHLHHLVVHNAVQHPERRGILRDIGLAVQTVRLCDPAEREEVWTRLRTDDRATGPVGTFLTTAITLADGRVPTDPFRRSAAVGYLLAAEVRHRDRRTTSRRAAAAVALVNGPGEVVQVFRSAADPWELESTFEWVATLERRWPRLGRGVRIAGGVARSLLALASATGLALRARRLADELPRVPPEG